MDSNISKAEDKIDELQKLTEYREYLVDNLNRNELVMAQARKELALICTHVSTETKVNRYEGGYDHKSRTETIVSCEFCKTVLSKDEHVGSYS